METILKQKVYHDGTSMVVLKPGDEREVPADKVAAWRAEGVIFDPDAPEQPEPTGSSLTDSAVLGEYDDSAFIDRVADAVVAKLMTVARPGSDAAEPRGADEGEGDGDDGESSDGGDALTQPREPRVGDAVTSHEKAGGWHEITAPWLAEPVKVRGDAAAAAKVAELEALIPTEPETPAAPPA